MFSLCWDCKNATGGCSWSNQLKPVDSWEAKEINPTNTKPYSTYIVYNCPLFIRDAYEGGQKRMKENK